MDPGSLPVTVEEYWNGHAHCLTAPEQLDLIATSTVQTLRRYSEPSNKRFGDLRLVNRTRVGLNALDDLTRALPLSEIGRRAAGCTTIVCVSNRIFGDPQGLRLLYLLVRYQYNASHLADPSAVPWTASELEDILLALEDLPDAVAPFYGQEQRALVHEARDERLTRLFPASSSKIIAISSPSRSIGIRTSDAFRALPQHARRAAIFHELAHDWLRQQGKLIDAVAIWQRAMVADELFRRKTGRPTSVVSRYALTGPEEDFAESAVAYRYAPELIMRRAPNRARLLQSWLFDGLSYENPQGCGETRAISAQASIEAFDIIPRLNPSPEQIIVAVTQCQWRLRDDASRMRVTHGRLCIGRELYRMGLAESLKGKVGGNDPVSRAIRVSRASNESFLEYRFGSVSDARIMQLTDRRAIKACGDSCHVTERKWP